MKNIHVHEIIITGGGGRSVSSQKYGNYRGLKIIEKWMKSHESERKST